MPIREGVGTETLDGSIRASTNINFLIVCSNCIFLQSARALNRIDLSSDRINSEADRIMKHLEIRIVGAFIQIDGGGFRRQHGLLVMLLLCSVCCCFGSGVSEFKEATSTFRTSGKERSWCTSPSNPYELDSLQFSPQRYRVQEAVPNVQGIVPPAG